MLSDDRIISYNMTDNLLTKGIITMNFLEERIMKDGVVKKATFLKQTVLFIISWMLSFSSRWAKNLREDLPERILIRL